MTAKGKTNAVRALDALSIAYALREYEVDESDLSAESVAAKVSLPNERVYKTLLVRGEKTGHFFAVIAADRELDLKAAARAVGDKSVETVALKELQPLTGYIRGGVTALAAKRAFPVVLDAPAMEHESVAVSAGMRGMQMVLAPADYVRATRAKIAEISRAKAE